MAKDLPDALRLREVKYGAKTTDEERIRVARRLEEEGRLVEALDLYLIAGAAKPVSALRSRAIREGRPVLLLSLARAGQPPSTDEWRSAADRAYADGRYREAYRCYAEAQDEAGIAKVRERLPDYEIYTPQGK